MKYTSLFLVIVLLGAQALFVGHAQAAFPTVGAATATQFSSSVTSFPVTIPGSPVAGDLLIACDSTRNAVTWTVPTNWVQFANQAGGGGSVGQTNCFYKIAAGGETTATWTSSTGTTGIFQVRKITTWHGTTPPEATCTSGDASAANPPSLSPSWGAADNAWIADAGHAAITTAAWSAGPSGYAGFLNSGASSGGSAVSIGTAYASSTASSEDPGAFTVSGSNRFWAACTIGIRPAAAVAAGVVPSLSVFGGTLSILGGTLFIK